MHTTSTSAVPHTSAERHEPRGHERRVPHLVRLLQAEDPRGHGVHHDRAHQRDHAHHAQGRGRRLARLVAQVGPQVHDGQDEVHRQHDDVPHERRPQVGVREQLPQARRLAQVHHHEADGRTVQQTLVQMATFEMPPKPLMPSALGTDEMMRPPAERPTKNMKHGDVEAPGIQVPHAVCAMPPESCTAQSAMPTTASTAPTPMPTVGRGRPSRSASQRPSPRFGPQGPRRRRSPVRFQTCLSPFRLDEVVDRGLGALFREQLLVFADANRASTSESGSSRSPQRRAMRRAYSPHRQVLPLSQGAGQHIVHFSTTCF